VIHGWGDVKRGVSDVPIYVYQCKKCEEIVEEIQKFSDPPLEKHDECGGELEKMMGKPSFQLKGGGWYRDGYTSRQSGSDVARKTRESLTGNKED
jgi:putative FmdB family regulatory protein